MVAYLDILNAIYTFQQHNHSSESSAYMYQWHFPMNWDLPLTHALFPFQQFWHPHDRKPDMERLSCLCFGPFSWTRCFDWYFCYRFLSISTSSTTNTKSRICFYTNSGEIVKPKSLKKPPNNPNLKNIHKILLSFQKHHENSPLLHSFTVHWDSFLLFENLGVFR